MSPLMIGPLHAGGIITNYSCSSTCGHCLYNCSPRREKDYLQPEKAKRIVDKIRELGCYSVHIGGGEPFVKQEALVEAMAAIDKSGAMIEYIETNCSWYKEELSAIKLIKQLMRTGVNTLLISISPFHNSSIPFNKTESVIKACHKAGMNIFPWIQECIEDLAVFDKHEAHSLEEFQEEFGADYLVRLTKRYWVRINGRALETYRPLFPQKTAAQILAENSESCRRELADTSHFHIDLFGNYIPGLCTGLAINMEDLGKPLDSGKYPLLNILANEGINGLVNWAAKEVSFEPLQPAYLNKCDLCTELRYYLFKQNNWTGELKPEGFYSAMGLEA